MPALRPSVAVVCSVVVLVGAIAVVRLVSGRSVSPAQAGCAAPSDVLDLTGWKVQLPTGQPGNVDEIEQPELNGFVADPWFVPTEDCTGIRFRSAVNGVTTPGSDSPRSELREMTEDGLNEAEWSTSQGTHTMTVRGMVTHLPDQEPQVIAAQVHGGDVGFLTGFHLDGTSFYIDAYDTVDTHLITDSYELGTPYELRFVAGGGQIEAYFNGQLETTIPADSSTAYFKTGAYTQANCESSDPCNEENYGETVLCGVEVTHEGSTAGPTGDDSSSDGSSSSDSEVTEEGDESDSSSSFSGASFIQGEDESDGDGSGSSSSEGDASEDDSSGDESGTTSTPSAGSGGDAVGGGCGDGDSQDGSPACTTTTTASDPEETTTTTASDSDETTTTTDTPSTGPDEEESDEDESGDEDSGHDEEDSDSGYEDSGDDDVDADSDYDRPTSPPSGPVPAVPDLTGFAGVPGYQDQSSGEDSEDSNEEDSASSDDSDSVGEDSGSSGSEEDSTSSESEAGESTSAAESETTGGDQESDDAGGSTSVDDTDDAGDETPDSGGSDSGAGSADDDAGCPEPEGAEPEPDTEPAPSEEDGGTASSGSTMPAPDESAPEECLPQDAQPAPGETVCFFENLADPLEITTSGTEGAPVHYRGNGIEVPGIRVNADYVVVEGFVSRGAEGTGLEVVGDGITVRDNQITQVAYAGDDLDGIRFFGDGIQLLDNHVFDLEASADIGDAHIDCMQTFATSGPGSSDIVIQGNRCEQIRSQCLMAEGPNDEGGSGEGQSRNWLFDGNYCDSHAEAQSVALEDIQDVTISNNEMVGTGNKAFALGAGTTGTVVRDNQIGPEYGTEVGFDDPSAAEGYDGPPVAEDGS